MCMCVYVHVCVCDGLVMLHCNCLQIKVSRRSVATQFWFDECRKHTCFLPNACKNKVIYKDLASAMRTCACASACTRVWAPQQKNQSNQCIKDGKRGRKIKSLTRTHARARIHTHTHTHTHTITQTEGWAHTCNSLGKQVVRKSTSHHAWSGNKARHRYRELRTASMRLASSCCSCCCCCCC